MTASAMRNRSCKLRMPVDANEHAASRDDCSIWSVTDLGIALESDSACRNLSGQVVLQPLLRLKVPFGGMRQDFLQHREWVHHEVAHWQEAAEPRYQCLCRRTGSSELQVLRRMLPASLCRDLADTN